jgi:RNA polymerase sigma factor (TIGR02999 family)
MIGQSAQAAAAPLSAEVAGSIIVLRLGRGGALSSQVAAITELIEAARGGDEPALKALVPIVYAELKRVARRQMRRERPGQTLQTTALVHEAYLRLVKDTHLSFANRAHLLAIASQSMREILVERARARHAAKRGGQDHRTTLGEAMAIEEQKAVDVLDLDHALGRLAELAPEQARIVELRFFGGLTNEEIAGAVGVSVATVKRHWTLARAWLYRELTGGGAIAL